MRGLINNCGMTHFLQWMQKERVSIHVLVIFNLQLLPLLPYMDMKEVFIFLQFETIVYVLWTILFMFVTAVWYLAKRGMMTNVFVFSGFLLGIKDTSSKGGLNSSTGNRFRNPFDIPRKSLLDQIVRMRANYLQVHFLTCYFPFSVVQKVASISLRPVLAVLSTLC